MGTLPSQEALNNLITKERLNEIDFVVIGRLLINIGTQECERSLFSSFFYESKSKWEAMLS